MKKILMIAMLLISQKLFSGTDDIYKFKWLDPDKKVFVLQEKSHLNKGRFSLNFGYGFNQYSDFQDSRLLHLSADYFFNEQWGMQLLYNKYNNKNNDTYSQVSNDVGSARHPYLIKFNDIMAAAIIYAPFYGKINTYNFIYYIDWSFGLGFEKANITDNFQSFLDSSQNDNFVDFSKTGFLLKTQMRFFLSDHWLFNIDFMNHFVKIHEPANSGAGFVEGKEKYTRAYDFIFSVGYSF